MEAMHVDTKGPTAKGAVVEEQKKVWLIFSNTGLMIVLITGYRVRGVHSRIVSL